MAANKFKARRNRNRIITGDVLLPLAPSDSRCYTSDEEGPYSRVRMKGQIPQVIIPVIQGAPSVLIERRVSHKDILLLGISFVVAFCTFAVPYIWLVAR